MDKAGLDLNDACQHLITNLKMHFTNAHNSQK